MAVHITSQLVCGFTDSLKANNKATGLVCAQAFRGHELLLEMTVSKAVAGLLVYWPAYHEGRREA